MLKMEEQQRTDKQYFAEDGTTLHRLDGPAWIIKTETGRITHIYYNMGQIHRDGGPAQIKYDENGMTMVEIYFQNGVKHRDDGPAEIHYMDGSETVKKEVFYLNGKEVV